MKIGIIIKPNQKGQIVIPGRIRKTLGITPQTPLNVTQRGGGIYVYPIKEIAGETESETSYLTLLERTKGTWEEKWEVVRRHRRRIEIRASQKRKRSW